MALYIAVESDSIKARQLIDDLHESFIIEFSCLIMSDEPTRLTEFISSMLRSSLNPRNSVFDDIMNVIESLWGDLDKSSLDVFKTEFRIKIADSYVNDFILEELEDCGLEIQHFGDHENMIVNLAAQEVVEEFLASAPYTNQKRLDREDFRYELLDRILSNTYKKLTKQTQSDIG